MIELKRTWDLNHQPKDIMLHPWQRIGNIQGMHTEQDNKHRHQFLVPCIRCGRQFWSYRAGHYQFCKECKI